MISKFKQIKCWMYQRLFFIAHSALQGSAKPFVESITVDQFWKVIVQALILREADPEDLDRFKEHPGSRIAKRVLDSFLHIPLFQICCYAKSRTGVLSHLYSYIFRCDKSNALGLKHIFKSNIRRVNVHESCIYFFRPSTFVPQYVIRISKYVLSVLNISF